MKRGSASYARGMTFSRQCPLGGGALLRVIRNDFHALPHILSLMNGFMLGTAHQPTQQSFPTSRMMGVT